MNEKSSSSPKSASAFKWIPSFGQLPECSLFHLSPHSNRGQMILDADDGNVARAHVKIKPIALSQRQGSKMAMDENEWKHRETLRKALRFIKF